MSDIPTILLYAFSKSCSFALKFCKKAIACGTSKINVNTELQAAWAKAVREFLEENKEAYDPRKVIGSGEKALKEVVREKVTLFGTKK